MSQVLYLYWLVVALAWSRGTRLILAGSVLLVSEYARTERVPLAVAELKRLKQGWHARWMEGRRGRKITFRTDEAFLQAVKEAAEAAGQADPATVPLSEKEAALAFPLVQRLVVPWPVIWLIVGTLVLSALAIWQESMLMMLPLALPVLFWERLNHETQVLLAGEHLYLLGSKGEIHAIPLDAVREVVTARHMATVLTLDPLHPTLKVRRFSGQSDFAGLLRRRLAGEPAPKPQLRTAPPQAPAEEALRCTLCGRPEPGAPKGSGIFICERCSGRTRHEASEAGHGLTPKDPRPM